MFAFSELNPFTKHAPTDEVRKAVRTSFGSIVSVIKAPGQLIREKWNEGENLWKESRIGCFPAGISAKLE